MKSKKLWVAVMGVAMATIVGAGAINAQMLSGYESFKKGVRKTLYADNATMDIGMEASWDGKTMEKSSTKLMLDKKNGMRMERNTREGDEGYVSERYINKQMEVYCDTDPETNEPLYYVYEKGPNESNYEENNLLGIPDDVVNIMELSVDAFIGTAKEGFVKDEASNTISGTFDRTQIPEIGNAFLSLIVSETKRNIDNWYDDDKSYLNTTESLEGQIYRNGIQSAYINSVSFDAQLDDNDYITDGQFRFQLLFKTSSGKEIPMDVKLTLKMANVGSTKITMPNVSKDDANVSWSAASDSADYVDYYEVNKDVIDRFDKFNQQFTWTFYDKEIDAQEKERLMKALEAFEKAYVEAGGTIEDVQGNDGPTTRLIIDGESEAVIDGAVKGNPDGTVEITIPQNEEKAADETAAQQEPQVEPDNQEDETPAAEPQNDSQGNEPTADEAEQEPVAPADNAA